MLKVEMIENGIVIDHIGAGKGKRVMDVLGINENYPHLVALVMNVSSRKKGRKDMVKISGIYMKDEILNKVALVSPNATINIIKNSSVVSKQKARLPEELKGMGKCPNPNCITNDETVGDCSEHFSKNGEGKYKCIYCERTFPASELL